MNAPFMKPEPFNATKIAQENKLLAPRFYTTDFAEIDRIDVSSVREEWDKLMEEMKADPNSNPFKRNEEFDADFSDLPPDLDKEFRDFLISSITAEFSGCVLYAEMKKHATNKNMKEPFSNMSRDGARGLHQRHFQGLQHRRRSRLPDQG